MSKAILRYFFSVLFASLLFFSGLFMTILSNELQGNTIDDMTLAVQIIDSHLDYQSSIQDQLDNYSFIDGTAETRITIIAKDGTVLGDSEVAKLENHADRNEVQEAIEKGIGVSNRYSQTVKKNMLYVAYFNGEYIVRVSMPYDGITEYFEIMLLPFLISIVISFLLSWFVARVLAQKLATPVEEIKQEIESTKSKNRLSFKKYQFEEFNVMTSTIEKQAHEIVETKEDLEIEKSKINSILDQMNEGLILLDDNHKILLVNQQVNKMYQMKMQKGHSISEYVFTPAIIDGINKVGKKKEVIEVKIRDLIYSCLISKIEYGVIVLFVDVTLEKNALKFRQEFFSNVSHELKTPMTSIKGYSELLEAGLIHDENMKKVALHKIQDEVENMSVLINDILMISRLENKDIEDEKVPITLKLVAQDVIESIKPLASKRNIELINECGDHTYVSSHQQMHQLLNNLIVNAVKYNVDGGSVIVKTKIEGSYLKITIKDTGIGIPLADQGRVFERFYRVEKGRDKLTGGNGLGLSIVKHIVQFNKGYIDLKSALDKGTTMRIYLPLKK